MSNCIQCGKPIAKYSSRYCSNKCQGDYQYNNYIADWKAGMVDGSRGVNAKNISRHLTRYLLSKYSNACSACGWDKKNPVTEKVPLEIDHIDGDAENNNENNLRLLCPNCHALTPSYRNLNKGNGRGWRRLKYLKTA